MASPGPLTTQPIIEIVKGSEIFDKRSSSFFTVPITSKPCLAHEGHEIILTPLCLNPRLFKILKPTFISSTGSADRETLNVSPIPSARS